jgi:hypothetical protein
MELTGALKKRHSGATDEIVGLDRKDGPPFYEK